MQPHEILEELSNRGFAPSLLYNDDGGWMVSGNGIQSVGEDLVECVCFIEEQWYGNITDAVNAYLIETGEKL